MLRKPITLCANLKTQRQKTRCLLTGEKNVQMENNKGICLDVKFEEAHDYGATMA